MTLLTVIYGGIGIGRIYRVVQKIPAYFQVNETKANKQVVIVLSYNTSCSRLKQCLSRTTEGPLSPNDVKFKCGPL